MSSAIGQDNNLDGLTNGTMDNSSSGLEYDAVDRPRHYNNHKSGVECITITEQMNFCLGNAVKYIWRAGEKGDVIEDLKKARWYIDREINRLLLYQSVGDL